MAETRRWEVLAFARKVRDLTFDNRIASFGGFFAANEGTVRESSARSVG